jgi:hypothetical protein
VLPVRIPIAVRRFLTHRIVHDTYNDRSFIEKDADPSDLGGKRLSET